MKFTIPLLVSALCLLASCSEFKAKKTEAESISHLRRLHTALDAYMADNNHWPQVPEELKGTRDVKFFDWWKDTLRPYGMKDEFWFRPDDAAGKKAGTASYLPMLFDADTFTPYRFQKPWAAEREDFGDGKLLLFPDGSISTEADYLEKQKQEKQTP